MALRLLGQAEVRPDFVSPAEEAALARELEPQLRRRHYQFDHWDGVSGAGAQSRGESHVTG